MKKVLLFGFGNGSNSEPKTAGVMRTEQFAVGLEGAAELVSFLIGGANEAGSFVAENTFLISRQSPQLFAKAREIARSENFAAAVGVNTFPAFVAARSIPAEVPFWADLNGWIMAEMQAQSFELKHNDYLAHGWTQEQAILQRADKISTVSTPQKFAVVGELATLGRLTKDSFREENVAVVPNIAAVKNRSDFDSFAKPLLRGESVPQAAFLVLQVGGFNNCVDEETLFSALEKALAQDPSIHFVTTGGALPHIAEQPFARFTQRIQNSQFQERFQLLGWRTNAEVDQLYAECDLGIMADLICLETETGARNRLNEMMARGLPFITTAGSELSYDILQWNCGKVVESGDSAALSAAILTLKESPELRSELAKRAQEICTTELTALKTIAPLRRWLQNPK